MQALKKLGVASLVMITVGSVDSIRNLPATALFGPSLIFFFTLAAIFFLLPAALVSAELSSTSPKDGGVYAWVSQALSPRLGYLAVWFQWTENVIWYPTILSFVAATIGYLFSPALAHQRWFLMSVIIIAFWGATFINLMGVKSSARFASLCAVFGLIVPMSLIIVLGIVWVVLKHPLAIHFSLTTIFPHHFAANTWVAMTGIIMSFCGIEIATVHSEDVLNPQVSYPSAMLITTLILLGTLVLGSLAIAMTVPVKQLSLVAGIMQSFNVFLQAYHLQLLLPLVAIMLVIGGLGGVSNWIIAPTKGLSIAANDGHMPKWCAHHNKHHAPNRLLWAQAVLATIMTSMFLWLPSINAVYWLLTAVAAQQYMLMYILMFIAGLYWRKNTANHRRGFRIPGGRRVGLYVVCVMGLLGAVGTFIIGFFPPANIHVGGFWRYEGLLLGALVVLTGLPFLYRRRLC